MTDTPSTLLGVPAGGAPAAEGFADRHIGPRGDQVQQMLTALGLPDLNALAKAVVPGSIRQTEEVDALRPTYVDQKIGVVGPDADGFAVRAFFPVDGALREDPVTGSLNASVAQWLLGTGRATAPYVARQTTGRVHIDREDQVIWVGGRVVDVIRGEVIL